MSVSSILVSSLNQRGKDESSNAERCAICLSGTVNTRLLPCSHQLICAMCVSNMRENQCPVCRTRIERVFLEQDGVCVAFQDILSLRIAINEKALRKTVQVVFVGDATSGKRALVRSILQLFGRPVKRDENDFTFCIYNRNARIGKDRLRFSYVPRSGPDDPSDTTADLRYLQPNVIVVCINANKVGTRQIVDEWTAITNNFRSERIIWLVTAGDNLDDAANVDGNSAVNRLLRLPQVYEARVKLYSLVKSSHSIDLYNLAKKLARDGRRALQKKIASGAFGTIESFVQDQRES